MGLQQDAQQDEGDAKVEGEIDLTPLTENEEGEDDRIAGFEVVSQIDGEGRKALECLNLKQIHRHSTEKRMAEHEPKIRTLRDNHDRLLAWEKPQINRDDRRDEHKTARHLIHQYRTTADAYADLFIADGIDGTDGRRQYTYHNTIAIARIE